MQHRWTWTSGLRPFSVLMATISIWVMLGLSSPPPNGWTLHQGDDLVLQAPSLNFVLTEEARETLGLHFILKEEKQ